MKKVTIGIFNFCEAEPAIEKYFFEFSAYCKNIGIEPPAFELSESKNFPKLSTVLQSEECLSHVKSKWGAIAGKLHYLIHSNQVAEIEIPKLIIFMLPSDWPISGNAALDGGTLQSYRHSFAILGTNKKYKELFFHELFHFFGVSEGYSENTYKTINGCEDCWMQFEPKKGKGLCASHQNEFRAFLNTSA